MLTTLFLNNFYVFANIIQIIYKKFSKTIIIIVIIVEVFTKMEKLINYFVLKIHNKLSKCLKQKQTYNGCYILIIISKY